MVKIDFYKDEFYDQVIKILKDSGLFDEVWETRRNLKNKILRDPQSILVAKEGKEIIGCLFISEDQWNAMFWRICVREDFRKKGIGQLLIEKAEKIVRKKGLKEVGILVDPKKENLKKWYSKQGFLDAREWTYMYKKLE